MEQEVHENWVHERLARLGELLAALIDLALSLETRRMKLLPVDRTALIEVTAGAVPMLPRNYDKGFSKLLKHFYSIST